FRDSGDGRHADKGNDDKRGG
ncbi:hypothetical protein NO2_1735, partial [Candidatus Termititenax persephonae]